LFPQIETAMYILLSNYFQQTLNLWGKGDVQSSKHVKVYVYEFWGFCCDECSDCGPLCCDTM